MWLFPVLRINTHAYDHPSTFHTNSHSSYYIHSHSIYQQSQQLIPPHTYSSAHKPLPTPTLSHTDRPSQWVGWPSSPFLAKPTHCRTSFQAPPTQACSGQTPPACSKRQKTRGEWEASAIFRWGNIGEAHNTIDLYCKKKDSIFSHSHTWHFLSRFSVQKFKQEKKRKKKGGREGGGGG
jgi:hypothetical protein